jgi:hypothetical protein
MAWDDGFEQPARDLTSIDFRVVETDKVSAEDFQKILALFQANYRQANRVYLEKSLETLRYVALAEHEGTMVGFGFGESRVMDLPRLPAQVVNLAGICCIAPQFRRRGLFEQLEYRTMLATQMPPHSRRLTSGRMAHPAAMRKMALHPTVVPKPGVRPTPWQQQVGQAIAAAYGSHAFDPETFVCIGTGEPTGYPIIDFEVEPWEWEVFRQVNRDRGDALLVMVWTPDAPPGW